MPILYVSHYRQAWPLKWWERSGSQSVRRKAVAKAKDWSSAIGLGVVIMIASMGFLFLQRRRSQRLVGTSLNLLV